MDMSTSREVDRSWSETKAGVSSLFAVVTEEKVLQMLTFLECVVLSLNFVYVNTVMLYSLPRFAFRITNVNYRRWKRAE